MNRFRCKACGRTCDAVPKMCACGNNDSTLWERLPTDADTPQTGEAAPAPYDRTPADNAQPHSLNGPPEDAQPQTAARPAAKKPAATAVLSILLALTVICAGVLGYIAFKNHADPSDGSADGAKKRSRKDSGTTAATDGDAASVSDAFSSSETTAPDGDATSETDSPTESIATFTVPDFKGKAYDALIKSSEYTAYLQFVKAEAYSDTVPAGQVIEQSIAPNANVPTGTQITLTVSKGAGTFALPDVTQMGYDAAVAILRQKKLICVKVTEENPGDRTPGTVRDTLPPADSAVKEGDTVTLYVWGEKPAQTVITPDQMTNGELLSFFNASLNRIKTNKVGFKKSKLTSIQALQLSNPAANSVVGIVKSALLSDTPEETRVNRGQSSDDVFSPSGKYYVSHLQMSDLTDLKCVRSGDQYVITLTVRGETNPAADGSIMSRGFDFMTVDDVVNIYAPKVKATVKRENIQVDFSGCTAKLTVTADGQVLAYETYVMGVMRMNEAKIVGITTDLDITLASTTTYSDFSY